MASNWHPPTWDLKLLHKGKGTMHVHVKLPRSSPTRCWHKHLWNNQFGFSDFFECLVLKNYSISQFTRLSNLLTWGIKPVAPRQKRIEWRALLERTQASILNFSLDYWKTTYQNIKEHADKHITSLKKCKSRWCLSYFQTKHNCSLLFLLSVFIKEFIQIYKTV